MPRLLPGGHRRIDFRIFPYYISYIVRDPMVWIVAIAHAHKPGLSIGSTG